MFARGLLRASFNERKEYLWKRVNLSLSNKLTLSLLLLDRQPLRENKFCAFRITFLKGTRAIDEKNPNCPDMARRVSFFKKFGIKNINTDPETILD